MIRGATSSFGQAAVKMAVNAGAHVVATTRSRDRVAMLDKLGVWRVETRTPGWRPGWRARRSMPSSTSSGTARFWTRWACSSRGGTACLAGWLGGLDPIADFNPLLRMASGVNLTFFGSFVFGSPAFPLSDVPLGDIARQVADGLLDATPSQVFGFDEIVEAHRVMEAGQAGGKMVVTVP